MNKREAKKVALWLCAGWADQTDTGAHMSPDLCDALEEVGFAIRRDDEGYMVGADTEKVEDAIGEVCDELRNRALRGIPEGPTT